MATLLAKLIFIYCVGYLCAYPVARLILWWADDGEHHSLNSKIEVFGYHYLAVRLAVLSWIFITLTIGWVVWAASSHYMRKLKYKRHAYRVYKGMKRDMRLFKTPAGREHMQKLIDEAYTRYKNL